MNSEDERAWSDGHRAAFVRIAQMCAGELDGTDRQYMALLAERIATVSKLRELCAEVGDEGEWPDDLYLPDIIEKHILRHLLSTSDSAPSSSDRMLADVIEALGSNDSTRASVQLLKAAEYLKSKGMWKL